MDITAMEEQKGLLRDDEHDVSHRPRFQPRSTGKMRRITWFDAYFLIIHILLLCVVVVLLYLSVVQSSVSESLTILPGLRDLPYNIKIEHATDHTYYGLFAGPPSSMNTLAWQRLLRPLYFNASTKELVASNTSMADAVKVADGGYVASLGVYHELHCLNQLRYFLYNDRFNPDMSIENKKEWTVHLDHCIEVLRLSSTCRADTSLYTFTWPENDSALFLEAHSNSPQKCVDWKELEDWSGDRRIYDQTILLKPGGDMNRTTSSLGVEEKEN